ncbi:MAG: hypothetical protein LBL75_03035 [Rickettsiales bacterium]|jgi:hypothetical protein|nr:hypothetical protein [Rickettsiales bacterium]
MNDNTKVLNKETPRETIVYADGNDFVIKKPNTDNSVIKYQWVDAQKRAINITNNLNSPYYLVPHGEILLKNGDRFIEKENMDNVNNVFVKEQRMYGEPVTKEFYNTLDEKDKQIIARGIAHLLVDQSKQKKIKTAQLDSKIPDVARLDDDRIRKIKMFIPEQTLDKVLNIQKWLIDNYKGPSEIFWQGDLAPKNVFYNKKTQKVSIIDFANSIYEPVDSIFYRYSPFPRIERIEKEYRILTKNDGIIYDENQKYLEMRDKIKEFYIVLSEYADRPLKEYTVDVNKDIEDYIDNTYKYLLFMKTNIEQSENIKNKPDKIINQALTNSEMSL